MPVRMRASRVLLELGQRRLADDDAALVLLADALLAALEADLVDDVVFLRGDERVRCRRCSSRRANALNAFAGRMR